MPAEPDANPYHHEQATDVPARSQRTPLKSLGIALLGVLMLLYIVNLTFGVFELLPDNLPVVGNLDEATATALLLGCLSYFGIDLPWMRRSSG